MEKITGYFVDPENCIAEARTVDKSLEGYYALLRCDLIEMPDRRIGGEYFTLICDEEALLRSPVPPVSAYDPMGNPAIFGPLFVVRFDGEEDVRSLTVAELQLVESYIMPFVKVEDLAPSFTCALTGVEY